MSPENHYRIITPQVYPNFFSNACGLIDRSPVHPREVFADALVERASGIIVAHNHPAGILEPSLADVEATKQLKAVGAVVGIELLDHIIFNRSGYFSFLESGRL